MARQAEHYIKDERLQVQDSILLFEKNSLWQGRKDIASMKRGYRFRTVFCCQKNSLCLGRQDTASGTKRLQVEDSILLLKYNQKAGTLH